MASNLNNTIYFASHRGMVGSAVVRRQWAPSSPRWKSASA